MNKFRSLVSIQLKDSFARYSSKLNLKNNILGKLLLLLLLFLLAIPAITFSSYTYKIFEQLNQPELIITMMYVGAVFICLFLSISFIMSQFFYSRDLRFLSSLPVKEDLLVFSKLSTAYVYMLVITLIFILPPLVIYALNKGLTLYFLISALIIILVAPILPLMIAALLILIMSPFISGRRKKSFTIIYNILLMVVIIGVQLGLSKYTEDPEQIAEIITQKDGLLGLIGMKFPPSIWLTKMLMGSLVDGVLFIGINILFIILIKYLAAKFYRKALLGIGENYAVSSGNIRYVRHSKDWQLLKRNVQIILSEPIFLINTLGTIFIPILLFIIYAFMGLVSVELLNSPELSRYVLLIFTGILSSPAIISSISATAITREGKAFWQTKILPLSTCDNMRYRILTTVIFELVGLFIVLIFSAFILPITTKMILLGSAFAIALTLFLAVVDFIINIYRPLLKWTNPTAAVKNNMNVMLSLGIRVILAGIVYLLYKVRPDLFYNFEMVIGIGAVVFFLLYLLARYLLYNTYAKKFSEIAF